MFRLRTKARAAPRVSALISFAEANGPSVLLLYTSLRIRTETSVVNCSVAIAVTQHEILRGNARRHAPRRTDPAGRHPRNRGQPLTHPANSPRESCCLATPAVEYARAGLPRLGEGSGQLSRFAHG